ncbi:deoxynucleoside triphosphate triphosphohydrolase SAMHD1-like [Haliotis rubra]|uniref:deoxynucleoside triphosphate triphosphohydrolase SAMHD1-like n=1 Tax=Haliotis rubra TaxID=36100 RepID=UPI001EE56238|nr:deoxynucleoside triphosphate triphosphohydrolase SAMHD1-like [Haliotis rubra]
MVAYSKLNDSILQVVELPLTLETSQSPKQMQDTVPEDLKTARGILKRLQSRDLYKCVGNCILSPEEDVLDIEQTKKKITEEVKEHFKEEDFETLDIEQTNEEITEEVKKNLNEKYFEIVVMSFDYGKKKKDPVSDVWFYRKENVDEAINLPQKKISQMLPQNFQERTVVIYSKEKTFEKAIARSFKRRFPDAEIPGNYDDEPAASQG